MLRGLEGSVLLVGERLRIEGDVTLRLGEALIEVVDYELSLAEAVRISQCFGMKLRVRAGNASSKVK